MRFILKPKTGSHAETDSEGKVRIYTSAEGHVFETDHDLAKMFPGKFERVTVGQEPPVAPRPSRPAAQQAADSPLGTDATKMFPAAVKNDFRVFAQGGAFFVAEPDALGTALNKDPLKKPQVEEFIDDYLK